MLYPGRINLNANDAVASDPLMMGSPANKNMNEIPSIKIKLR